MRIIVSTICGLLVGLWSIFFLAKGFFDGSTVFGIIHYPALLFYEVWKWLGLPPHGCFGFAMIFVSIVVQWVFIGFLIGLISYIWSKKQKKKAQPEDSANSATASPADL
jgi:hypothetical protein